MAAAPVFVAGAGVISAIGNNRAECLESLKQARAGIAAMRWLRSIHQDKLPVAEVKSNNDSLSQHSGLSAATSRTALLSMLAAREAVQDASIPDFQAWRSGFVSANSVGGMDKTEDFFLDFLAGPSKGKLRNVVHHECGSVTEIVADKLGIRHHVSTISTACSSSANAIFFASKLISHNLLDLVVAGGTDSLTRFTLNGFHTLMILDPEFCKPFDQNRQGLNLGEGAGYLVLVSDRVARTLGKEPYCRIGGYGNANDAYHQTASSPEGKGSFLAMKGALHKAGLLPSDIGYINLHGTGTQNNDIAEGSAIKLLFDPPYPKMSSTKSFTGHTLGASGGIEAVFSAMAVKEGYVYPNLRWHTPMSELPFTPETAFSKNHSIKHVMSNSFGFGGNCSSLIFSKL
jgi:3-oxoacyl-[acyl-carrier-protein] synthase I